MEKGPGDTVTSTRVEVNPFLRTDNDRELDPSLGRGRDMVVGMMSLSFAAVCLVVVAVLGGLVALLLLPRLLLCALLSRAPVGSGLSPSFSIAYLNGILLPG
ncbi:unnamed protein product [Polarella glacialis]|uniref:Uncharacterized protein n=1 Tax=Polarella glacialis TaxID=89957 RepID=A0A813D339_POLGL|nr:unnamed protein product [Polarella glacialis]